MTGSKFNATLGWTADRTVIGLLTFVAAMPTVTASAALAGGAQATQAPTLGEAIPRFWRVYRNALPAGILPSVVAFGLAISALTSLGLVGQTLDTSAKAVLLAASTISGAAAVLLVVYSACCAHLGVKASPRNLGGFALLTPAFAVRILLLALLIALALGSAAIVAFPLTGVMAAMIAKLPSPIKGETNATPPKLRGMAVED